MREFTYTVTKEDADENLEIKDIFRKRFSFSARLRKKIKYQHLVYLNGVSVPGYLHPIEGDEIKILMPEERSNFTPQDVPIIPLFEDEDLLIINKQAGFVVHPTKGTYDHTIANGVAKYMQDTDQVFKIRFVNRLDMDTSGVLILGKNSNAQDNFVKQQKRGEVSKKYLAIVNSIIDENTGEIDLPIGFESEDSPKRCVRADGRPSKTGYKVLERFYSKDGNGFTAVELKLYTGRTHQIRVHMSYIGHPLVSDPLYGSWQPDLISRQALHAINLSFKHPVTGEKLDITAPLPGDMQALFDKIRQ